GAGTAPGGAGGAAPGGAEEPGAGGALDLNTADQAALEELPGVGPVTAEHILAWRTEHGRFTSVDELMEVSGIGEKTLETLRPHVSVR
uniref:ComEA family DNA-binding protein n=1 Tax=Kytococcus schroeteri TaxID=138300 RepID=UPI00114156D9